MHTKNIEMLYEHAAKITNDCLDVFQAIYDLEPLRLNNPYKVIWSNRYFKITLFDDPDDLGYCSMLHNYDPSTYVLCDIIEYRSNGKTKHEMIFGFDIEKGTFLELFEILHYNVVGTLREYPNYESKIESELKDVVII